MNQWLFVYAAYGVTLVVAAAILCWSWAAMRRAEQDAEAAKRR